VGQQLLQDAGNCIKTASRMPQKQWHAHMTQLMHVPVASLSVAAARLIGTGAAASADVPIQPLEGMHCSNDCRTHLLAPLRGASLSESESLSESLSLPELELLPELLLLLSLLEELLSSSLVTSSSSSSLSDAAQKRDACNTTTAKSDTSPASMDSTPTYWPSRTL
jgi:hypothetical protein